MIYKFNQYYNGYKVSTLVIITITGIPYVSTANTIFLFMSITIIYKMQ